MQLCVKYHHSQDVGSNLYKSKKMRVVSLWNDLPWLHNDFQVEKVQICFGKLKNFGLSFFHNDSSNRNQEVRLFQTQINKIGHREN